MTRRCNGSVNCGSGIGFKGFSFGDAQLQSSLEEAPSLSSSQRLTLVSKPSIFSEDRSRACAKTKRRIWRDGLGRDSNKALRSMWLRVCGTNSACWMPRQETRIRLALRMFAPQISDSATALRGHSSDGAWGRSISISNIRYTSYWPQYGRPSTWSFCFGSNFLIGVVSSALKRWNSSENGRVNPTETGQLKQSRQDSNDSGRALMRSRKSRNLQTNLQIGLNERRR